MGNNHRRNPHHVAALPSSPSPPFAPSDSEPSPPPTETADDLVTVCEIAPHPDSTPPNQQRKPPQDPKHPTQVRYVSGHRADMDIPDNEPHEKRELRRSWAEVAKEDAEGFQDTAQPNQDRNASEKSSELPAMGTQPDKSPSSVGHETHQKATNGWEKEHKTNGDTKTPLKVPPKPDASIWELKSVHLQPGDFGTNIGDAAHQAQGAHHEKPRHGHGKASETKELASMHLQPGDFGSNIGDEAHQKAAHDEHPPRHRQHHYQRPSRSAEDNATNDVLDSYLQDFLNHGHPSAGAKERIDFHHQSDYQAQQGAAPHRLQEPPAPEDANIDRGFKSIQTQLQLLEARISALEFTPSSSSPFPASPSHDSGGRLETTSVKTDAKTGDTRATNIIYNPPDELPKALRWILNGGALLLTAMVGGYVGAAVENGSLREGVANALWRMVYP